MQKSYLSGTCNYTSFKNMNSPVLQLLLSIIAIDKKSKTAVYIQLSQQIIEGIQRSILVPGTKLPGSRILSVALQLNRNTVVAAYEELNLQGWIKIEANKGAVVLHNEKQTATIRANTFAINNPFSEHIGFFFESPTILNSPYEVIPTPYYFTDGTLDPRIQQLNDLSKNYRNALKKKSIIDGTFDTNRFESKSFTQQLANYINVTRGLRISKDQLATSSSKENLLYIITKLLVKPKDIVLVADIGNFTANMIFEQSGARVIQIPCDDNGIDIEFIKNHFLKGKIRCLYCTPNRHYPTTRRLSAERRLQLIQLAKEYRFAIIEDDFDYELQWDHSPSLPMAASDNNGCIIYLGNFASHLISTFQKGVLVAPQPLIQAVKNYSLMIEPQKDVVLEYTLAQMIDEGEIYRLAKKSVLIYKKRRDFFCELLSLFLSDFVRFNKPTGGYAVYIEFKTQLSLLNLKKNCEEIGLTIPNYLLYQKAHHCGIRLGFAHLNEEEQEKHIELLKMGILKTLEQTKSSR